MVHLEGPGAGSELEGGWCCERVIFSKLIPFSNKREENQDKLNNKVQYRLSLTKHNAPTCAPPPVPCKTPGQSGGWRGWWGGSGRGFVSGGGSAHRPTCGNKSTCGLPCFTPELALVSSWAMFQGLLRGVGEGWVWAGREEIHGVCEPLGSPGWAGFLTRGPEGDDGARREMLV